MASARPCSLIKTAETCGVEAHGYLSHLFAELPKARTAAYFEALLPWYTVRD